MSAAGETELLIRRSAVTTAAISTKVHSGQLRQIYVEKKNQYQRDTEQDLIYSEAQLQSVQT